LSNGSPVMILVRYIIVLVFKATANYTLQEYLELFIQHLHTKWKSARHKYAIKFTEFSDTTV